MRREDKGGNKQVARLQVWSRSETCLSICEVHQLVKGFVFRGSGQGPRVAVPWRVCGFAFAWRFYFCVCSSSMQRKGRLQICRQVTVPIGWETRWLFVGI